MRVLFCGDRNWIDRFTVLFSFPPETTVCIQGGAQGADYIAAECARFLGIPVESYWADWGGYGEAAGPIRNKRMLDEGKPDLVIAFHADIDNSKGTKDMVNRAKAAGIPVRIVTGEESGDGDQSP